MVGGGGGGGRSGRERKGTQGGMRAANPTLSIVQLLLCSSPMLLIQCPTTQKQRTLSYRPPVPVGGVDSFHVHNNNSKICPTMLSSNVILITESEQLFFFFCRGSEEQHKVLKNSAFCQIIGYKKQTGCLQGLRWRRNERNCLLMDTRALCGVMKMFSNQIVVMAAQFCEYTKSH